MDMHTIEKLMGYAFEGIEGNYQWEKNDVFSLGILLYIYKNVI